MKTSLEHLMPDAFPLHPLGVILACLTVLASHAYSQSLNLDSIPEFPTLTSSSLEAIEKRLRPQIAELDRTGATEGSSRAIIDSARRTFRRIILELTQRARQDTTPSLCIGLQAERLAASVSGLDATLRVLKQSSIFTGSPPQLLTDQMRQRALDRLSRFSGSGLELLRRSDIGTITELDSTLATALAPIVEVISIIEHRTPIDRWPTHEEISMGLRQVSNRLLPITGDTIIAQADARLAKAQSLPQLAANARSLRILLQAVHDAPEQLHDAGFDAQISAAVQARVLDGAAMAMRIEDWEKAVNTLRVAEAALRSARAMQRLEEATSSRTIQPAMLRKALGNALAVESSTESTQLLDRTRSVVELLGTPKATEGVLRELAPSLRKVGERRLRLERQLIQLFPVFAEDSKAMQDPEISSLIAAITAANEDEDKIRSAALQIQRLTAVRPSATREFTRRIRTWCRMLGEDGNRNQGANALDVVSQSFQRYMPMPFESQLRNPDPAIEALTGGGAIELARRMDMLRTEWANEIALGELQGPRGHQLDLLARLGSLLEDLETVAKGHGQIREALDVNNQWGAWYLPAQAIEWTARSIGPGLKVAVSDALSGEMDQLERDLDRLEQHAPPARLLGWLASRLATPMAGTIGGASGLIIASALPPSRDAWLIRDRSRLAAICRGLLELDHANRTGAKDDAGKLTAFIVQSSRQLLEDLGAENP